MTDAAALPEQAEQARPLMLIGALAGVIVRPRAMFTRLREIDGGFFAGHWWLVFVLAFVALVLVSLATLPIQAKAAQETLAAQQESLNLPEMSTEEQAQVEQMQQVFTSQTYLGVMGIGFGAVGLVINLAVRALVLFLLGLAVGARASFKQVWRMSAWTSIPDVVRSFIQAIAVVVSGQIAAPGLAAAFTTAEAASLSPVLMAVLQYIDIYLIWGLVLIGVGVKATSKLSLAKGAACAVAYFLLGLVWVVGMAALGQALTSAFGVMG
jgi:hypothetical protein